MTPTDRPTIDIDELCKNPEEGGFNKVFTCDKCGSKLYCSPDFEPPGCMTCSPELWEKGEPTP